MKEAYSRLRGDALFNGLLHKIDTILQQSTPSTTRLAAQPIPPAVPAASTQGGQDNPWAAQGDGTSQTPNTWADNNNQMKETGPTPDMSAAPIFNQNYIIPGTNDFGYDPMGGIPMPGDEWSPSMSDGVGWDWSCFSQLLADQFQPQ